MSDNSNPGEKNTPFQIGGGTGGSSKNTTRHLRHQSSSERSRGRRSQQMASTNQYMRPQAQSSAASGVGAAGAGMMLPNPLAAATNPMYHHTNMYDTSYYGGHAPPILPPVGRAHPSSGSPAFPATPHLLPHPHQPPHHHYYHQDHVVPGGQQASILPAPHNLPQSSTTAAANTIPTNPQMTQQEDIDRGVHINFYAEADAMLLASWASFFRDQYLEAQQELEKARYDRSAETYRRVSHFVERVELKIAKTPAMRAVFRQHPFTPMDDPIFVDSAYRAIIDFMSRNPPFDGFAFGNPTARDYMWFKAGLKEVVEDGRTAFCMDYANQIQDLIDPFVKQEVTSQESGTETKGQQESFIRKELLDAATLGMQHPSSYRRVKQFYSFIYIQLVVSSATAGANPRKSETAAIQHQLGGKKVRDVFGRDEEGWILAIVSRSLSSSTGNGGPSATTTPQDVPTPPTENDSWDSSVAASMSLLLEQQEIEIHNTAQSMEANSLLYFESDHESAPQQDESPKLPTTVLRTSQWLCKVINGWWYVIVYR